MSVDAIIRQAGRLSHVELSELRDFVDAVPDPHSISFTELTPRRDAMFVIFTDPKLRPPVLDEMMPDIENVIRSIATKYTDQSCPALHTDELVGEGRYKLAKVLDANFLIRARTRTEFFKVLKTAVNNHVKGLVHAHRFTVKRTGKKPPPRDQRFLPGSSVASTKPIEISLDDPDSHLQVGDIGAYDAGADELRDDIMSVLTPLERIVLTQQLEPNQEALCYATIDSHHNRKPGSIDIRIKETHLAEGLGVSVGVWRACVDSIRVKTNRMQEEEIDPRRNAAVQQLSQVFGVQVPRSIDIVVVRRLFTLAARDHAEKITNQIVDLLRLIGARPPEVRESGTVACFGVLFKTNNAVCSNCGLRRGCEAESANYGLTSITVDSRMLGTRGTRTALLTPISGAEPIETEVRDSKSRSRDTEVLSYVTEHFKPVRYDKWTYYKHRENGKRSVFRVESSESAFSGQLSFCKPKPELQAKLDKRGKGTYYVPSGLSLDDAIALVNEHAAETIEPTTVVETE